MSTSIEYKLGTSNSKPSTVDSDRGIATRRGLLVDILCQGRQMFNRPAAAVQASIAILLALVTFL